MGCSAAGDSLPCKPGFGPVVGAETAVVAWVEPDDSMGLSLDCVVPVGDRVEDPVARVVNEAVESVGDDNAPVEDGDEDDVVGATRSFIAARPILFS